MKYDHSYLAFFALKRFGTLKAFAEGVGISTRRLYAILNDAEDWRADEIGRIVRVLNISADFVDITFFMHRIEPHEP